MTGIKIGRALAGIAALVSTTSVAVVGCLDRPVVQSSPTTSNVFVDQVQQGVTKIDLLFMIDNSASMGDKQEILGRAVPAFVQRLTSPNCISDDPAVPAVPSVNGVCASGRPEFPPVADIHVGIVTSSLGSHGGTQCADSMVSGGTLNDHGHLLGTVRPTGSNPDPKLTFDASRTWNNSGFLAWDANQADQPPGVNDREAFKTSFQDMVLAAGEHGCGYEASLESWYRFLVDPEPPANVTLQNPGANQSTTRGSHLVVNTDGSTRCDGCDTALLAQRQAFLRPDSLVAVVMLSDENDCSIRDDGQGWLVSTTDHGSNAPVYMPKATSACASNPNDACCRSCAAIESAPPSGCSPIPQDPACSGGLFWNSQNDDPPNLRCFEQKRRFGIDLLYPTQRYVNALTSPNLTLESDGKTVVPNPLFTGDATHAPRNPSLVFFAGIVGVPWQDIADDASLHSATQLTYLNAQELTDKGRWSTLLGDPSASPPVPPSDPFMIESIAPRTGTNPITGDAIVPANSTDPKASPINSHEYDPEFSDLQYACTFQLATAKPCQSNDDACDCSKAKVLGNSPLCQPVAGGAAGTTQYFAKAYPGTRELQVLHDVQNNGIVASICPKVTTGDEQDLNFGYNPAVAAIIDRLKGAIGGSCLPRPPATVKLDGGGETVACQVIEARLADCGDCSEPGRVPLGPEDAPTVAAVHNELKASGLCDAPGKPACDSFCQCGIRAEVGDDLVTCQKDQTPENPGYCYIDDPQSPAVANCASNQKRILRFAASPASPIPAQGAYAFVGCIGAAVQSTDAGE